MQIRAGLSVVLLLSLNSVVTAPAIAEPSFGGKPACVAGNICRAKGTLYIRRETVGIAAELKTGDGCYAIVLSPKDYKWLARRPGLRVSIIGRGYAQDCAEGVVSMQIGDRMMPTGLCQDRPAIYVTSLKEG